MLWGLLLRSEMVILNGNNISGIFSLLPMPIQFHFLIRLQRIAQALESKTAYLSGFVVFVISVALCPKHLLIIYWNKWMSALHGEWIFPSVCKRIHCENKLVLMFESEFKLIAAGFIRLGISHLFSEKNTQIKRKSMISFTTTRLGRNTGRKRPTENRPVTPSWRKCSFQSFVGIQTKSEFSHNWR